MDEMNDTVHRHAECRDAHPSSDEQVASISGSRQCSYSTSTEKSMAGERYVLNEVLGAGAFATVHNAIDRQTGRAVAVKVLRTDSRRTREQAAREAALNWRVARSIAAGDNGSLPVATIIDAYEESSQSYLVFDLLAGGDLESVLVDGVPFSETDTRTVMRRLLQGIDALHRLRIAHCDIKPENLVFQAPADLDTLKIVDLGLASDLRKSAWDRVDKGTAAYSAPELVEVFAARGSAGACGAQVDEWAAGVVMYRLLCGNLPFEGNSVSHVFDKIRKFAAGETFPDFVGKLAPCSENARDLLSKLLAPRALQRISARDALLHHPFLWTQEEAAVRMVASEASGRTHSGRRHNVPSGRLAGKISAWGSRIATGLRRRASSFKGKASGSRSASTDEDFSRSSSCCCDAPSRQQNLQHSPRVVASWAH